MIIYICVCIHVWIHACIHVCVHVCIHVCICVCIRVCIRVFYMYVYMIVYTYVSMYVYMYVYTPLHTSHVLCTYLLTNAFVYIYIYMAYGSFSFLPQGVRELSRNCQMHHQFQFHVSGLFLSWNMLNSSFQKYGFLQGFFGPLLSVYMDTHINTHAAHTTHLHLYMFSCRQLKCLLSGFSGALTASVLLRLFEPL